VVNETELRRIVEWCAARDVFLMFDETYEFFIYDGRKHASAAKWFESFPETVIVVNSMSKTFAMTGWRLGWAIAHPDIVDAAGKIQSHSTSNPSSISQAAALEALRGADDEVKRMYDAYTERRAWLVPAINAIDGFRCTDPDGAFYVFPEIKAFFGRGGIRRLEFIRAIPPRRGARRRRARHRLRQRRLHPDELRNIDGSPPRGVKADRGSGQALVVRSARCADHRSIAHRALCTAHSE